MSSSRKHGRRRATIIGSIIGFIIIFSFLITLISPDLGSRSNSSSDVNTNFDTPEPTAIVVPTAAPDPQLEGAAPFIHSSGLFSTFRPAGTDWFISESGPDENSSIVRVVIQSPTRLTVIHNYIQPGVEYETLASLSENFLTIAHFSEAWQDYDSWIETSREVTDDAVIIDFDVKWQDVDYIARSINWLEDGSLFATRVVTPADNTLMLDLTQQYVMASFKSLPGLDNVPETWPAFVDQITGYILKYPSAWEQVAGAAGRAVTFAASDNQGDHIIRTWTEAEQPLAESADVVTWVEATEPNAEIISFTSQEGTMGMRHEVAYTYVDTAGDSRSGLMVLLNDAAGTLFIANLQTAILNTNLLTETELSVGIVQAVQAVRSGFVILPEDMRAGAE